MKNHRTSIVSTLIAVVAANIASAQPNKPEPPTPPPTPAAARAEANLDQAKAQLDRAAAQLDAAQVGFGYVAGNGQNPWVFGGGGSSSAGSSLVIPKEGADAKVIEECEEDLNVMSRILEKAASRRSDKGHKAMGISVHASVFGEASAPRNLYIEGYGVLFFLNVNYPLLAPPTKKAEAAPKEETSTEWEETRRELYQPSTPQGLAEFPVMARTFGSGPAEEYDSEKIDDLKQELIGALKNAAHIRRLKSDETVTIVVNGRSGGFEPKVFLRKTSTGGGGGGGSSSSASASRVNSSPRKAADGRSSKMILRAKKSDLEAFQKEKLSMEEFRKKVSVQVF